jgi:hypothetical protein
MIYACVITLSSDKDVSFYVNAGLFTADVSLKAGKEKRFYLCSSNNNYFLESLTSKRMHQFTTKKDMSTKMIEIRKYIPSFCTMKSSYLVRIK